MKWTMISVALLGLSTCGLIFLAQMQHGTEPSSADRAAAVVVEPDLTDSVAVAPVVVETTPIERPVQEPAWAGDPWVAGVAAFEAGDGDVAVDALRAAVAEREDSAYRHYLLGLALRRVGDVAPAVAEIERSLELSPGTEKPWLALARCELDREQTGAAREAVDAALEIDLESADAWHLLGRIELAEGSIEPAEAAFARAFGYDPEHAWAANNLGYVRILQENFTAALGPLEAAIESGLEEPVFFNNLGIALERSGHDELAALAFAHAAVRGHGPAEQSLERVEQRVRADRPEFAALDEVEQVDGQQLAIRVRDIVGALAAAAAEDEVADEDLALAPLEVH